MQLFKDNSTKVNKIIKIVNFVTLIKFINVYKIIL